MTSSHPLRMLYNLFAGRGPAPPPAVSPAFDVQSLAAWQRTLATLISNPTKGDSQLIRHLGDSLRSAEDIYAAQICYLCANEVPRDPADPHCRIALLGVDHHSGRVALTPLAFQLTEVCGRSVRTLRGILTFRTFVGA